MVDQIEVKILIQILSLMFTEIKIMKQSNIENSFIQLFSGIEDQNQIKTFIAWTNMAIIQNNKVY